MRHGVLLGVHDFASFAASTGSEDDDHERSTERDVFSAELARSADDEELVFTVSGRSFLRYMVQEDGGDAAGNRAWEADCRQISTDCLS